LRSDPTRERKLDPVCMKPCKHRILSFWPLLPPPVSSVDDMAELAGDDALLSGLL
jgi:hypothetical protein